MKTYKEFINEARQPTWRVYFKGGPNPVVDARNTAEAIKKAEKIAKKQKPNHSLERTGKGVEKLREALAVDTKLDESLSGSIKQFAKKMIAKATNSDDWHELMRAKYGKNQWDSYWQKAMKNPDRKWWDKLTDRLHNTGFNEVKEGWGAAKQKPNHSLERTGKGVEKLNEAYKKLSYDDFVGKGGDTWTVTFSYGAGRGGKTTSSLLMRGVKKGSTEEDVRKSFNSKTRNKGKKFIKAVKK